MRKWLIPLLVLLLLLAGGGVAYVFWFAGRVEMTASQRGHLEAEANRLAADRDRVEQQDARWIALQLPDNPSADDLARLGETRLRSLYQIQAETLARDYPELWDAWDHRAKQVSGSNGNDALLQGGELSESIRDDPRFKAVFESMGKGEMSVEDRAAFFQATEPLMVLVRRAAASDDIVWIPRRQERWLDETPLTPAGYWVFKVLGVRVRMLAAAGNVDDAMEELDVLMSVYARLDWNLSLMGNLTHAIISDFLLRDAALPLVERHAIPQVRAQRWLELAADARRDVVHSIGVDLIQSARMHTTDPTVFRFVNLCAPDLQQLAVPFSGHSVEELFESVRRNDEVTRNVCAYLKSSRQPLLIPEGQLQIAKAFENSPFLIFGTLRDDVAARLAWSALAVRIAEREQGSLTPDLVDQVLADWPAVRAEWEQDTLKLWCREEYHFGQEPTRELCWLEPIQRN